MGAKEVVEQRAKAAWEWAKRVPLLRAAIDFFSNSRTDNAAALTYYSVLSLFPALVVGVAVIGMLDRGAIDRFLDTLTDVIPNSVMETLNTILDNLHENQSAAGTVAVLGTLTSLWAAGNYIVAFGRAADLVAERHVEKPWWRNYVVRLALILVCGVLGVIAVIAVASGADLVRTLGDTWGDGEGAAKVWAGLRWPTLALVLLTMIVLLYSFAPSYRLPFRPLVPGAVLGMVLGMAASFGLGYFVSNVKNYNAVYGTLGGFIVFLIWLWLMNVVILLGYQYGVTRGKLGHLHHLEEEQGPKEKPV
ncbi:YihY/virulence factor BrkB family protein [Salininema proteolyticum]|uniref:YihY/virulence factor BrkB family protein n=1 Tax=Salininema proteolyticum TaxID=1607685 RepID=A0ABV8TYT9_9ACTN